jgi:hypothetical protein
MTSTTLPPHARKENPRRAIRFVALALTLLASCCVIVTSASSASATPAPISIAGTGGEGVNIRPTPDTSQAPIGWMPEGASPDFVCWTPGENVGGVDVWFDVNYAGVNGYYASYWDNSSYAADGDITAKYGIPQCGQAAPSDATDPGPWAYSDTYNGAAAADYARVTVKDPQPFDEACAWFVSQALWVGGLPEDDTWNENTSHGQFWNFGQGSPTAADVTLLTNYLLTTYPASRLEQINFTTNAVPDAQLGDVIIYVWNGDTNWMYDGDHDTHMALVTDISPGQYPDVSEWGDVGEGGISPDSPSRGWTYSLLNNNWLQVKYPQVIAYLLHIDNGTNVTY